MPVLAVVAPFASPTARGNAITIERIVAGLRDAGLDIRVWDLSRVPAATLEAEVEAAQPALIHAFHAYRTGPLGLRLARRLEVPLVVTLTGTDANHDLFDPDRAASVRRVLEGAGAVTAFHRSIVERVVSALPDLGERLVVVPQAVRFGVRRPFELTTRWSVPEDRILFVFPGGIRPVKAPRVPLGPLDPLAAAEPRLRLLYVGPALDADETSALRRELQTRPWARYLGAVTHAEMHGLLAQADVVLNCSLSEGGMPNSILEALAMGRAVLASDIPGNRSLVADDVTGLLFRDPRSLAAQAGRLVRDPALRARLGAAGRALVEREFTAERERDGYVAVYRRLTPVRSG